MIATLACALLIVVAAVLVGRAAMLLAGWRRPDWLAGAVGLAVLVTLAPFLIRLPGRGLTAAILLALLALACAWITKRAVPSAGDPKAGVEGSGESAGEQAGPGAGSGGDPQAGMPRTARARKAMPPPGPDPGPATRVRAQHATAIAAVLATLALACLPFLFNERTGILGEGIYTNDQAAQLYWADWLADGFGPQPKAVQVGYPVGPQALAASVSEGTGADLVDAFNGLLLAIPALTALAALSALAGLPPLRRGTAAVLTGMPYLGASFLAQSGFKETAMALFVLVLALALHVPAPGRARAAVVALLAIASVFTFSLPGLAWFVLALPLWAGLRLAAGDWRLDRAALAATARRHRRPLIVAGALAVAVAVVAFGPAASFVERIDDVQESSGRLSSPVFPGEALGIWPEGDFRIVRGDVEGALVATGFAALCALLAGLGLLRRRESGLAAVLMAAAGVYVLARPLAEIHVEAKALAVLAPLVMLVVLRWGLAETSPGRHGSIVRLAVGSAFAALALWSTFLALRAAPVGFDERGRDLEALAERIDPNDDVVFLGVDRFAGYWLRGTLARSPGGYVPAEIGARTPKTWQQGQALDFDTLDPVKLNRQELAITTAAAYGSTPPPNWREVAREGDYVLWERAGEGPAYAVLPEEGGAPGARLDCEAQAEAVAAGGTATVLEEPSVGEHEDWEPGSAFTAPGSASQQLQAPPGGSRLSLQYHSQVPLTVRADGERIAELPPSLEGFYLVGAGRGAFWPAGEVDAGGDGVEIEVEATEPSGLQELLGVERRVWLGQVALSSKRGARQVPLGDACGEYVDHYAVAGSGQ